MKTLISALIVVIFFSTCKKDEVIQNPPVFLQSHGLLISSEGKFQSANASVTYYNPSNGTIVDDVFYKVNNRSLGDVCQSMSMINGKVYMVINNSGRIEICNPNNMDNTGTIFGLTSPRYILKVDSNKAYVSDLFSNHLSVINLDSNTVSSKITLNGWTEQMLLHSGKVYVTNVSTDYLYVINPSTNHITDSILISKGGSSIKEDKNGKLWVLCSNDYLGTYTGKLYRINPATKAIEHTYSFSTAENPSRLCFNSTKDTLYYINTNVYKMAINAGNLPSTKFITSNSNSFYGLTVDPSTNDVYVSDAIDYIQKGRVYRYSAKGNALTNFLAGIAPGDFMFY